MMPRPLVGFFWLAPLALMSGCASLLGDFSLAPDDGGGGADATGGEGQDATTDGAMANSDTGGGDVTQADAHDAGNMRDSNVPDVAFDGNCSGTTATITPSGTVNFCPGKPVTLTASAAATYSWTSGASTQSIQASNAAMYTVTTVDSHGCRATSAPVTLTAYPAAATPTITGPASFCKGSTATLTASSAANYVWSPGGATTQTIAATVGGLYTVTTTDANGCSATSTAFTLTQNAPTGTMSFAYTAAVQTWTPPACVSSITVDAAGGAGGKSSQVSSTGVGGLGGRVQATLTVTPGSLLYIYVGGAGSSCATVGTSIGGSILGGGGAYCGDSTSIQDWPYSGSGGGASDIRVTPYGTTNRILVAGGGGGAGYWDANTMDNGGAGGGTTGAPGAFGAPQAGGGGTQSAGGAGGTYGAYTTGYAGGLGSGSYGGECYDPTATAAPYYEYVGGGGGGGWYGGGGGCWSGGGGGSSYVDPALGTAVTHTQGSQSGNGYVTISW